MSRVPTRQKECHPKPVCPVCGGLECLCRPRFFPGQLLTEEDLNALDHYIIEKNKLHTRYLHGWGVACGLQVVCHECTGWVTVRQGYAVDPCGNDIILCEDHEFNLVEAINKCRRKWRERRECHPWRPPAGVDCKDTEQEWCLVVRYKEYDSRPFNPRIRKKCSCGCSKGAADGCGCGCHHQTKPPQMPMASPRPDACEPTRVCESYCLEVVPMKKELEREKEERRTASSGWLAELRCCLELIKDALSTAPTVDGMSPQEAHVACCEYREQILDLLASSDLTRCHLLDRFSKVTCPPPDFGQDVTDEVVASYLSSIQQEIQRMQALVVMVYLDCVCLSFLPPCPEEPEDSVVPLAAVTVKGDRILRICHFDCRKQMVTWPAISYWLSPLRLGEVISSALERICCRDFDIDNFVSVGTNQPLVFSLGHPVGLFTNVSDFLSFAAAGSQIRALSRPASAGELQSKRFLGEEVEPVLAELEKRGVEFAHQKVDSLPGRIVELAREATLDRLPADQPLLVYSRGDRVVGLTVLDEPRHVRHQLAEFEEVKTEVNRLKADLTRLSERLDDIT